MSCGFNFNTLPAMPLNATWPSVPIAASNQAPCAQVSFPCALPRPCPAPCALPRQIFSQCAQPLQSSFPVSRCANPIPVFPISAPLHIPFQFQTSACALPRPVIPRCATPSLAQIPAYPLNNQFLLPLTSCRSSCARRCC